MTPTLKGQLATFGYDGLGRRASLTRGNGTVTTYSYDPASRLSQLVQDVAGTAQDLTLGFGYNPAAQIASTTRSNDAYAWTAHYNVNGAYTANGLNQYTQSGPVVPTYDGRGNLTSAGGSIFGYTAENRLRSATDVGMFVWDPLGRLLATEFGVTTRFGYDGAAMISEHTATNQLTRRYVHGPGVDEPLVWYEGAGTTDRRWLHADERGSVIAVTNGAGSATIVNSYDEYGIPGAANAGRFQYTGQAWLPELGLYHYKARAYSPTLGRFLQTDPIGYGDGMNMYAYLGGDPVNWVDPSGMLGRCRTRPNGYEDIVVTGTCDIDRWSAFDRLNILNGDRALTGTERREGGSSSGVGEVAPPEPAPQSNQCTAPLSSGVGSARAVLETAATGADISTVGFTAGGITAPIAIATKLVGFGAEAGLLGVNLFDGFANGNWGALQVQVSGAATRLIPCGRTLQAGARIARGPTGILRNSRGQFRTSRINNPAVAEAGDLAVQKTAEGAAGAVACN